MLITYVGIQGHYLVLLPLKIKKQIKGFYLLELKSIKIINLNIQTTYCFSNHSTLSYLAGLVSAVVSSCSFASWIKHFVSFRSSPADEEHSASGRVLQ